MISYPLHMEQHKPDLKKTVPEISTASGTGCHSLFSGKLNSFQESPALISAGFGYASTTLRFSSITL